MPNEILIRTRVASMVAATSVVQVSRKLGISREAVARIAAGGHVRKGSMLAAAHALGLLAPVEASR